MKLIIQIPCYNEAKTLQIALDALPKHIDGIDEIEVLIIDDGCVDRTVEVAKEWGVDYIVTQRSNKGLAKGFTKGLEFCLKKGADIIVNTDADNQYCGDDIEKLVQPILEGKAHMVIGERPIDETEHFSWMKKKLQHFGSWVVRKASNTDIMDAPSGFRAISREAALQLSVINEYTYTLETIVQAGQEKFTVMSVPIRTNPELRESRLFNTMWGYVGRAMITIARAALLYRPIKVFMTFGIILWAVAACIYVRYLVFYVRGLGFGHTQSLILASMVTILGFVAMIGGLLGDLFAANRKLIQEIRYRERKREFDAACGKNPEEYEDITEVTCESRRQRRIERERFNVKYDNDNSPKPPVDERF